MTMREHWGFVPVAAALLAVMVCPAFATEREHEEHEQRVELFLGDADSEGEHGFTVGLIYEYRFTELLGLGGFVEYAGGHHDAWSAGVPLFVHPYGGWRFALAPGFEHRDGEDEFLFRTGVAHEFEVSDRWTVSPEFNVDFVDGEEILVFGL
jgi:hypothetical protein